MAGAEVKKVVLAYSGGLDTSVILKWLQETYDCEVVTFTADIGQGEEVETARTKAQALGVKEIYIDDLREEYARDFVFPMFRANAIYEGEYLLGTSIARPLIAKRQIEIARETGADAVSHGATGKGNDQVRFELGFYALKPDIQVIAPWREWDLSSRQTLLDYADTHGIAVEMKRGKASPYSMDANLLHISYEGGVLEDPWAEPEPSMWRWTVAPEDAPDTAAYIELGFQQGDIVSIDDQAMGPAAIMETLNRLGGANGVGRADIVENRYFGMKTRDFLNLIPDTEVTAIERCSGHDGTYAIKSETFEKAKKIARPVVNRVKQAEPDTFGSDCPMAGRLIADGLDAEVGNSEHPLSMVRRAYGV